MDLSKLTEDQCYHGIAILKTLAGHGGVPILVITEAEKEILWSTLANGLAEAAHQRMQERFRKKNNP